VKNVFSDISFHVGKGEILGIAGLVGAGRSEVARTLFGQYMIENGEMLFEGQIVHIHSPSDAIRMGLVYISEDRKHEGLYLQQSIRNNIIATNLKQVTKHGFIVEDQVNRLAKSSVSRMRVITTNIHQKVKNLSGGNQQKVLLSMGLATNPKVLIVDEPTRGVDVGAKAEIYQILRELVHNGLAIIMISSDLPEVLGLSDRIMVMREGRIAAVFSSQEATEQKVIAAASGI
jgi:ABC-type sugar transport system ATPase subunit